jgi:hypothetical protein
MNNREAFHAADAEIAVARPRKNQLITGVISTVIIGSAAVLGGSSLWRAIQPPAAQLDSFGSFKTDLSTKVLAQAVRGEITALKNPTTEPRLLKDNVVFLQQDWAELDATIADCRLNPELCAKPFQVLVQGIDVIKQIPDPATKIAAVQYLTAALIAYDHEEAKQSLPRKSSVQSLITGGGVCDEIARIKVAIARQVGFADADTGYVLGKVVVDPAISPLRTTYNHHAVATVRADNRIYVLDAMAAPSDSPFETEFFARNATDLSTITESHGFAKVSIGAPAADTAAEPELAERNQKILERQGLGQPKRLDAKGELYPVVAGQFYPTQSINRAGGVVFSGINAVSDATPALASPPLDIKTTFTLSNMTALLGQPLRDQFIAVIVAARDIPQEERQGQAIRHAMQPVAPQPVSKAQQSLPAPPR